MVRIAMVAGEVSGDVLGAGLIRELRRRVPALQVEGIGGARMQAEGFVSHYPMDMLTVMGFDAIERLPRLLAARRDLARRFIDRPPDLFIGIDVPDFNLGLGRRLRDAGIRTVHYVSPTVWAWRRWRIRGIRKAVDHMLTLFPFEERYYREQGVPVTFVGHPLADAIPVTYDDKAMRRALGLPVDRPLVALLPGSRRSELAHHADLFVLAAKRLQARMGALHFVAPFASEDTKQAFEAALARHGGGLSVSVILNRSREAMAAADVVLCASGTATLEAALLGKPMVVTYRISWLSYFLVKTMVHVRLYSLPNNLAGRELVPEFMQRDATPEKLSAAIARLLENPEEAEAMRRDLKAMHESLRRNADARAAEAVLGLLPQAPARSQEAS